MLKTNIKDREAFVLTNMYKKKTIFLLTKITKINYAYFFIFFLRENKINFCPYVQYVSMRTSECKNYRTIVDKL